LAELLRAAPHVKLLITSRELLRISGEHNFPTPPLSLPPVLADQGSPRALAALSPERLGEYSAVQFFIQRVVATQPHFALTPDNALLVAGICCRLDGLPLALELAAARVRHIPLATIYARLEQRLPLLTGGLRDLPPRQRTLRAAIEWSYNLLGPSEATVFRRMAVFHNGATFEAVEAINREEGNGATPLNQIASLVDKSLLRLVADRNHPPRFAMLETIREYAQEKFQASDERGLIRRRHALFFLALAEQAAPELRREQQKLWLIRLETEHDNLRAALRWALETPEAEIAGRLGSALWLFWERHSHLAEGRQRIEQILALGADVPVSMRAKLLLGSGFLAFRQGDYSTGRALEEESLRLHQELGDKVGIAQSFTFLADLRYVLGDPEPAIVRFEQALALWRAADVPWGIAKALLDLGEAARSAGDYHSARTYYEESLAVCRTAGDSGTISVNLYNLGQVESHLRDYEQAQKYFTECLLISQDLGNRHTVAVTLQGLAGVVAQRDQPPRAACLFGAADAMLSSIAGTLDPVDRAAYERSLAAAHSQLNSATWDRWYAEGQGMTQEQAIAYALAEASPETPPAPQAFDQQFLQPADLTRREREVARLIAQGLSNREIAAALVVTERTVEGHVSNILAKLHFRSRAQVAAWVIENPLPDR
jgi:non-specific serine/threonine protein kinase